MTVFVVEDNLTTAQLLAEELRLAGYEAEVAAFPLDLVARMRDGPVPDVVLLDYVLPGADGIELLRLIRREPSWARVPVVLTSAAAPDAVSPSDYAGPLHYLPKPFDPDALLAVLRGAKV